MSDFKFACPDCDQHVRCDESLGGHRVKCPGCGIDLVIPQPKPGATDELVMAFKLSSLDHDPSKPAPRPPTPPATPAPPTRVQVRPVTPAPPSAATSKPGVSSPTGTSTTQPKPVDQPAFADKRALQESQPRPDHPLDIPAAAKITEPAIEQIARDNKDRDDSSSGDTSPPASSGTGSAPAAPTVKPMPSIKLDDSPVSRPQVSKPGESREKESTSTNPPRVRILPKPGETPKGDTSKS